MCGSFGVRKNTYGVFLKLSWTDKPQRSHPWSLKNMGLDACWPVYDQNTGLAYHFDALGDNKPFMKQINKASGHWANELAHSWQHRHSNIFRECQVEPTPNLTHAELTRWWCGHSCLNRLSTPSITFQTSLCFNRVLGCCLEARNVALKRRSWGSNRTTLSGVRFSSVRPVVVHSFPSIMGGNLHPDSWRRSGGRFDCLWS